MEKEVFITGREGFVGTHLDRELKANGYLSSGTSLNQIEGGERDNIFQCDITEPVALFDLINTRRPWGIVHLAALVHPGDSFKDSERVFETNVGGTKNLLEAVIAVPNYNPRILIIGSSEEFMGQPPRTIVNETTPSAPVNPYGESKVESWKLAWEYAKKHGLDIVSAIPFNHTGPGQGLGFIASDVASQIVAIERGEKEPILITGNISHKRNFSDVRDVVWAYRLLLELGKTGERYIICADASTPLSQIVNRLLDMAEVKIEHRIDPARAKPAAVLDVSASHQKITQETGWKPEIPIEKTLKDLLDWYREERVR